MPTHYLLGQPWTSYKRFPGLAGAIERKWYLQSIPRPWFLMAVRWHFQSTSYHQGLSSYRSIQVWLRIQNPAVETEDYAKNFDSWTWFCERLDALKTILGERTVWRIHCENYSSRFCEAIDREKTTERKFVTRPISPTSRAAVTDAIGCRNSAYLASSQHSQLCVISRWSVKWCRLKSVELQMSTYGSRVVISIVLQQIPRRR